MSSFHWSFQYLMECPMCHELAMLMRRKPLGENSIQFHWTTVASLWHTEEGAWRIWYRSQCTATIITQMHENAGRISPYDDFTPVRNSLLRCPWRYFSRWHGIAIFHWWCTAVSEEAVWLWISYGLLQITPQFAIQEETCPPRYFIPGLINQNTPIPFCFLASPSAALQKEGLMIWDASGDRVFRSFHISYLQLQMGQVWHTSMVWWDTPCIWLQTLLPTKGRHKPNKPIYYPAMLLPWNYTIVGATMWPWCLQHPPTQLMNILKIWPMWCTHPMMLTSRFGVKKQV